MCSIFKEMLLSSLDKNYILIYCNFSQLLLETVRLWVHEWTPRISTCANESLKPFLLQLGKISWEASVFRYEFLFNGFQPLAFQNCYLCLHNKTNLRLGGILRPLYLELWQFEKVRGSDREAGSCPCVTGRAWEYRNHRQWFILRCIVLPGRFYRVSLNLQSYLISNRNETQLKSFSGWWGLEFSWENVSMQKAWRSWSPVISSLSVPTALLQRTDLPRPGALGFC